jgi:hypothetical protein
MMLGRKRVKQNRARLGKNADVKLGGDFILRSANYRLGPIICQTRVANGPRKGEFDGSEGFLTGRGVPIQ